MTLIEPGRIRARDLGRRFSIAGQGGRSLKRTVLGREIAKARDFWAVRHVDLDITPGETFGIVGRNGSGKSTLLKMLARIFGPSEGTCEVGGRLSSLLELGAGFHPEFSAIENIYLSAAIYGIPRDEVRRDIESILDFAELEDFKDQPVKTFSSGMFARLGFSVAMHVRPDVLLLDEVLAVGDEEFVHKCHARIAEYHRNGGTIVLVTHDATTVQRLCQRAVLLDRGVAALTADAPSVVREYHDRLARAGPASGGRRTVGLGDEDFSVVLRVTDDSGEARSSFIEGEAMRFHISISARRSIEAADVILVLTDETGRGVASSRMTGLLIPDDESLEAVFAITSSPFREGTFGVDVGIRVTDSQARLFHHSGAATVSFLANDALEGGAVKLGGTWTADTA